ncbi:AbrB/MazE/SpoVT family DNA-binding domain-containing protein [Lactiplantibacillus songbeiensis]|uniref:AbrB/MazE/SpoVT family DNA-binding domain-containing protein n=1 Tax=Lactiplantibacillus songbeiensis TaxID=2559920 RepID=A0ABW4BYX6_9LACO|nr:AbrB/MazE/SpoVT family DNA-binding domain-containing protein [Lactiplantibacillus songbeiensis]
MSEKAFEKSTQRQVAKFGNSLAVTIPADFAAALQLKKGDTVTVSMNSDKTLKLDANAVISQQKLAGLVDQAMAQYQGALDILAESDK